MAYIVSLGLLVCVWGRFRLLAEYAYLKVLLGDAESAVSGSMTLRYMGRPEAVAPLLRLLHASDPWQRGAAARDLERYRGGAVVDGLLASARADPDRLVRDAAIESLGAIGDPRALPGLLALADADPRA